MERCCLSFIAISTDAGSDSIAMKPLAKSRFGERGLRNSVVIRLCRKIQRCSVLEDGLREWIERGVKASGVSVWERQLCFGPKS